MTVVCMVKRFAMRHAAASSTQTSLDETLLGRTYSSPRAHTKNKLPHEHKNCLVDTSGKISPKLTQQLLTAAPVAA